MVKLSILISATAVLGVLVGCHRPATPASWVIGGNTGVEQEQELDVTDRQIQDINNEYNLLVNAANKQYRNTTDNLTTIREKLETVYNNKKRAIRARENEASSYHSTCINILNTQKVEKIKNVYLAIDIKPDL
jgi:hypothetical protein